ncbi:type IV secretory system conjugative DNA transfer family protein [Streptomyces vinaceus]|uniref:type IV secretory system conjugative DNA transfer family protein n=1 Tax=Streptomyces vinaceus TaxID=1960 RepID=UPI003694F611
MQSMTEATAPYTATAPTAPDTGGSGAGEAVGEWLASAVSWLWERRPTTQGGWSALLVATAVFVGWLHHIGEKRLKEERRPLRSGANGFFDALASGLGVGIGRIVGLVGRFVSGRRLRGEDTSGATFWKPGKPVGVPQGGVPVAQLGSVAAAPAPVSLGKAPGPSPLVLWLGKVTASLFARLDAYQGRGQRALEWLGVALVTSATWIGRLWRGVLAAGRGALFAIEAVRPVLTAAGRLAGSYSRWARAGVLVARLAVLAVVLGWLLVPEARGWILLGLLASPLLIVAAAVTGPNGLRWWTGYEPGPDELYGPSLWAALVQVLRLTHEQQEYTSAYWMQLPYSLDAEGARIVIRLPLGWLGSDAEKALMSQVIHSRIPGQWVGAYQQMGVEPYAEFTPKPPPPPKPELPTMVEWIPSDDPDLVHVGTTHTGPRYINVTGETPHWGISGGTGDGKTTVLLMPIVHGRQYGGIVDCITMKSNAFKDIEGESGIRVHKSGRAAVAAMAEFYLSMKAAESHQGTEYGDALPTRYLVIDEFASFVKQAKIWWKYGLQGKGMPPFEAWFHMILMQGRSARHHIVVGAHTFTRETFGDTETRDLVGTKGIVGPASIPKWVVTYGDSPRTEYDHTIKGRGVIGVTGVQEVKEIQYAYITPVARQYLAACEPAPAWHTLGEFAPWVTAEALAEAQEELAIDEFLPGGAYMQNVTLVTGPRKPRQEVPTPRSEHVTSQPTDAPVTPDVTPEPAVYSLQEACEAGILPVKYEAARQRVSRARKKGMEMPEGITVEGVRYWTAQELRGWWKLITTTKGRAQTPSM